MLGQFTNVQLYWALFLSGAAIGSLLTWYALKKTSLSRDSLTILQLLNFVLLVAYMLGTPDPKETVIIAMLGLLFGEPLGKVITSSGGKDDKKD